MLIGKSTLSDNRDRSRQFANDLGSLQSIQIRHFDIHQDQIRLHLIVQENRFHTIVSTDETILLA